MTHYHFFLNGRVICLISVLLPNDTGLSEPSVPCDRTAPIATLLTSVVNMKGFLKSGYLNKGSLQSKVLQVSKDFLYSSVSNTGAFPFSCCVTGLLILAKSRMNFL